MRSNVINAQKEKLSLNKLKGQLQQQWVTTNEIAKIANLIS
jgi:hypothetical protein